MDVDLNADLGESYGPWVMGDDAAMLEVVTSANVACGFHAGDPLTLMTTVRRAATRGVQIGAQVSYRDLVGFGRRFIDASGEELCADLIYQLGALDGICRSHGTRVSYVKPHGALYNASVHHEVHAAAVVDAVLAYDRTLAVLGLPGSLLLSRAAQAGLRTITEVFADRAYTPLGTLVPRSEPGAVLHDPELVAQRITQAITTGSLAAIDGSRIPVHADSICVHGDSPNAVGMARAVRTCLEAAGVVVAPFT